MPVFSARRAGGQQVQQIAPLAAVYDPVQQRGGHVPNQIAQKNTHAEIKGASETTPGAGAFRACFKESERFFVPHRGVVEQETQLLAAEGSYLVFGSSGPFFQQEHDELPEDHLLHHDPADVNKTRRRPTALQQQFIHWLFISLLLLVLSPTLLADRHITAFAVEVSQDAVEDLNVDHSSPDAGAESTSSPVVSSTSSSASSTLSTNVDRVSSEQSGSVDEGDLHRAINQRPKKMKRANLRGAVARQQLLAVDRDEELSLDSSISNPSSEPSRRDARPPHSWLTAFSSFLETLRADYFQGGGIKPPRQKSGAEINPATTSHLLGDTTMLTRAGGGRTSTTGFLQRDEQDQPQLSQTDEFASQGADALASSGSQDGHGGVTTAVQTGLADGEDDGSAASVSLNGKNAAHHDFGGDEGASMVHDENKVVLHRHQGAHNSWNLAPIAVPTRPLPQFHSALGHALPASFLDIRNTKKEGDVVGTLSGMLHNIEGGFATFWAEILEDVHKPAASLISKTLGELLDLEGQKQKVENFLELTKTDMFNYFSELMASAVDSAVNLVPGLSTVLVPLFMKLLNELLEKKFKDTLKAKFQEIQKALLSTVIQHTLPVIFSLLATELPKKIAAEVKDAADEFVHGVEDKAKDLFRESETFSFLKDMFELHHEPQAEPPDDAHSDEFDKQEHHDAFEEKLRNQNLGDDAEDMVLEVIRSEHDGELQVTDVAFVDGGPGGESAERAALAQKLKRSKAMKISDEIKGKERHFLPHFSNRGLLTGVKKIAKHAVAGAVEGMGNIAGSVKHAASKIAKEGIVVIRSGLNVLRDFRRKMLTTFKSSIAMIRKKITDGTVNLFSMLFYPTALFWIRDLVGDSVRAALSVNMAMGEVAAVVLPAVLDTVLLGVGSDKKVQKLVENQFATVFQNIIPHVVHELRVESFKHVFSHTTLTQFIAGPFGLMKNLAAMVGDPLAKVTATVNKMVTKPKLAELEPSEDFTFTTHNDNQPETEPEPVSETAVSVSLVRDLEENVVKSEKAEREVQEDEGKINPATPGGDSSGQPTAPGPHEHHEQDVSFLESTDQNENASGSHLLDWTRNSRNDNDSSRRGAYFLLPKHDDSSTSTANGPPLALSSMVQTSTLVQQGRHVDEANDGKKAGASTSFFVRKVIECVKVAALGLLALVRKSPKFLKHVLADGVAKRVASMAHDLVNNFASLLVGFLLSIFSGVLTPVLSVVPGLGLAFGLAMPGLRMVMQNVLLGDDGEDDGNAKEKVQGRCKFTGMVDKVFSSTVSTSKMHAEEGTTSPVPGEEKNGGESMSSTSQITTCTGSSVLEKLLFDAMKNFFDDEVVGTGKDHLQETSDSTLHEKEKPVRSFSEILGVGEGKGDTTQSKSSHLQGLVNYLQSSDEPAAPAHAHEEQSGDAATSGSGATTSARAALNSAAKEWETSEQLQSRVQLHSSHIRSDNAATDFDDAASDHSTEAPSESADSLPGFESVASSEMGEDDKDVDLDDLHDQDHEPGAEQQHEVSSSLQTSKACPGSDDRASAVALAGQGGCAGGAPETAAAGGGQMMPSTSPPPQVAGPKVVHGNSDQEQKGQQQEEQHVGVAATFSWKNFKQKAGQVVDGMKKKIAGQMHTRQKTDAKGEVAQETTKARHDDGRTESGEIDEPQKAADAKALEDGTGKEMGTSDKDETGADTGAGMISGKMTIGSVVQNIENTIAKASTNAVQGLEDLGMRILGQLGRFLTQGLYAALVALASHAISRLLVAALLLVPGVRETPLPALLSGVLPALIWSFFKLDHVENMILTAVEGLVTAHVEFSQGFEPIVTYVEENFAHFAKAAVAAIRSHLFGNAEDHDDIPDQEAGAKSSLHETLLNRGIPYEKVPTSDPSIPHLPQMEINANMKHD
ncbi:unnamed protein product [Amoebophrya sp. A120]|nr:unnamed protein product [Amoebophrya sp. A120]|eukprot:GSA120T00011235001.1